MYPIQLRVTALDPIAHGAVVRFAVTATSTIGIESATARLVTATGGATNNGPTSIALGALRPGVEARSVFSITLPPAGTRQYLEFWVSGQGTRGTMARGACYNVLPDGPLEARRLVTTPQGARLTEVAAGRIGQ